MKSLFDLETEVIYRQQQLSRSPLTAMPQVNLLRRIGSSLALRALCMTAGIEVTVEEIRAIQHRRPQSSPPAGALTDTLL